MSLRFSETYLYKLHVLTANLDKLFDNVLRGHGNITLSQFTLLLAISEHKNSFQNEIARFLNVSPAAISRQVEIAVSNNFVNRTKSSGNRRKQELRLTPLGREIIDNSLLVLKKHAFYIFENQDSSSSLGGHIDMLSTLTKGALNDLKSSPFTRIIH